MLRRTVWTCAALAATLVVALALPLALAPSPGTAASVVRDAGTGRPRTLHATEVKGHYGGQILRDGRLDVPRMIAALKHQKVNTYQYLVSTATQWADLPAFLAAAQVSGIRVWAYLVPPSSAPRPSGVSVPCHTSTYVNGGDYVSIFRSLGRLSARYPVLTAIAVDDFAQNATVNPVAKCRVFSPEMVARMTAAARSYRPEIKFYPVLYHRDFAGTTLDLARYRPYADGSIFPYRGESRVDGRWAVDYRTSDSLASQVRWAHRQLGGKRLYVMVYAVHRCDTKPGSAAPPTVCAAAAPHLSRLLRLGAALTRQGFASGTIVYRSPLEDLEDGRLRVARAVFSS